MKPKLLLAAGALSVASLIAVGGVSSASADTDYIAKYGIKADVPGMCSYSSIDAKDYTGHEITILTHAVPV
ncbi:MAG: ABC transporter substrate-binding protein, partial [Alphaproteobacteria bacterium]